MCLMLMTDDDVDDDDDDDGVDDDDECDDADDVDDGYDYRDVDKQVRLRCRSFHVVNNDVECQSMKGTSSTSSPLLAVCVVGGDIIASLPQYIAQKHSWEMIVWQYVYHHYGHVEQRRSTDIYVHCLILDTLGSRCLCISSSNRRRRCFRRLLCRATCPSKVLHVDTHAPKQVVLRRMERGSLRLRRSQR